ncbi:DUF7931 domain-containing protein [Andreprevotia chitinilytica]|uniref:DUF7931 domain-containing protein n=1 Tax=Andreprevotia chitinilytica TaxID=396808 RepID=UPI0005515445|nr:hypothetical protein [Andreprevotia chitinilytica]
MPTTTTVTFNWPAETPLRFDSYADYRAGFTALLGRAKRSLCLFDEDFRSAELGSRSNCDQLWTFLSGGGQLTLIACRPEYLATEAPRFMQLRDRFAQQMQLLILNETAETDHQVFAFADTQDYLIRHHSDWARGEAGSSAEVVAYLQQKFVCYQAQSEPGSVWRRLDI